MFLKNPRVKPLWGDAALDEFRDSDKFEVVAATAKDAEDRFFIERNTTSRSHEYLDMTLVSVFYDAGIN